MKHVRP